MTEYNPIACSASNLMERAARQCSTLAVQIRDENGKIVERQIEVVDTLRLDRIVQLTDGNTTQLTHRC